MLKDIYFREPSDLKYIPNKIENNDELESIITMIKMILFTNRGEILGEPELGLDLEEYLFLNNFPENLVKERFYSQVNKFIPTNQYNIELDTEVLSDGVKIYVNLYIKINNQQVLGLSFNK